MEHQSPSQSTAPAPASSPENKPAEAVQLGWLATLRAAIVRHPLRLTVAGAMLAVAIVLIVYSLNLPERNGYAKDEEEGDNGEVVKPGDLFAGWRKPDFVILFSGQSLGYIQPCGCSDPQYGGLARRFNFMKSLKDKGWPVVAMDLGDMASTNSVQGILKHRLGMRSLEAMSYGAVGLGKKEYLLPLAVALGQHTIDYPMPRIVATSLNNTEPDKIWHKINVRQTELIRQGVYNVGVISVVSDKVARDIMNFLPPHEKVDIGFANPEKALEDGLAQLKKQDANISVLLFHGDGKEAEQFADTAYKLFKKGKAPLLHAILYLDEDPTFVPKVVVGIPTQIVSVGPKGKHVGVLGFFRNPKNLEMRYQTVAIGPDYQPKAGNEKDNPILPLLQKYSDELRKKDYLKMVEKTTHPIQLVNKNAHYVGSEKCKSCHDHAYKVWKKSAHSHAFQSLENATFPSGRQYDPECVQCHTVGFGVKKGFWDPPGEAEAHNLKLRNVGCESCHGPCSDHVKNPEDPAIHALINRYGPKGDIPAALRQKKMEWELCLKCHDEENDVHWGDVGFHGKWIKRGIAHPTPKDE